MTEESHHYPQPPDENEHSAGQGLCCPQCGSSRTYKDGVRRTIYGDVQRHLCRNCAYRFTEPSKTKPAHKILSMVLNSPASIVDNRQILRLKPRSAKNLVEEVETRIEKQAGATEQTGDIAGQVIAYLWELKKKGRKETTIKHYGETLNQLLKQGVDLRQPEKLKEYLAMKQEWSERTKQIAVSVYDGFLKWLRVQWEAPRYRPTKDLPHIPNEETIDMIIARSGKRLAPFLILLKETGCRRGEAIRLRWVDIDSQRKVVKITPLKGSNCRILPVSEKALGMLQTMPKTSDHVFTATLGSLTSNYYIQRKTLAKKLNDPRILEVGLHTLRHWKATTEYHKTHDIIHVMQLLGHADIKSTMVYINLEQALYNAPNDEFHIKTAKTLEEACKLAEVGFEHWDTLEGVHIYRKRK